MKILFKIASIAGILLFASQIASAQQQTQFPRQGSATYVTSYNFRTLTFMNMDEVGSQGLQEFVGITRNTDGQNLFDNMAVRCISYGETIGKNSISHGACIETDIDGDKVFTTFEGAPVRAHTFVGGTGKYKGISGKAPYTGKSLRSPGEGYTSAIIVEHKATWEIK